MTYPQGLTCLLYALLAQVTPTLQAKPVVKGTSVLAVRVGKMTTVAIYGENLAPKEVTAKPPLTVKLAGGSPTPGAPKPAIAKQVTVDVSAPGNCPLDTYDIVLTNPDGGKGTAKLAVVPDVAVEVAAKPGNASVATAMPLSGPATAVNGTLAPNLPAVFRFEVKPGETWEVGLLAGRAGSALNPVLRVRDGKQLSLALDTGDPAKDRKIVFKPLEAGAYFIEVSDRGGRGGAAFMYRLTLRRTAP